MIFKITNIWNYVAGQQPSLIESGTLDVAPTLQFYSGGAATAFPLYGLSRVLTVRYS